MKTQGLIYQINLKDNVGVALTKLFAGERCIVLDPEKQEVAALVLTENIPFGFKVALCEIDVKKAIVKYGEVIGSASTYIKPGDIVHINNLTCDRGYLKKEQ